MTFLLDARLELTPDEQELFERYRLYDAIVYDSDARIQHDYAASQSFEAAHKSSQKVPLFPQTDEMHLALGNLFASLWHTTAGGVHSVASSLSLQITLGSLVRGQHLESENLEETLQVDSLIREAAVYLANYMGLALTFDEREDLSEY